MSMLSLSQRTKRMRTSFKHHQLKAMKAYFALNHNPDAKDLKQLAQRTGLTKRVLQVWFQNARAKDRRSKQQRSRGIGSDLSLSMDDTAKSESRSGDEATKSPGGGDLDYDQDTELGENLSPEEPSSVGQSKEPGSMISLGEAGLLSAIDTDSLTGLIASNSNQEDNTVAGVVSEYFGSYDSV